MPRKPKVYTVRAYMMDKETGETKLWIEQQTVINADGSVEIINDERFMTQEEIDPYLHRIEKKVSKMLPDTVRDRLLQI